MASTQGIYAQDNRVYYCTIADKRVAVCDWKESEHEPLYATLNKTIDETVDLVVYNNELDERYFMRDGFQPVHCSIPQFAELCGMCLPGLTNGKFVVVRENNQLRNPAFWLALYGQLLLLMQHSTP